MYDIHYFSFCCTLSIKHDKLLLGEYCSVLTLFIDMINIEICRQMLVEMCHSGALDGGGGRFPMSN